MSKRILVIDDEPNVRLNYRITLETEGFTIVEADSAAKALEQIAGQPFDLAILDLRMPEMNGLDLLAEMRNRGITTPTVIITAYGDIPDAVRAMKLGAIDFLKKPLIPEQLRRITNEVIERHETLVIALSEADPSLSGDTIQRQYLQEAKRLLNLQDFERARITLAKAMQIDPLAAEAFNLAGVLFEMQEDYDHAKNYYSQAIKIDRSYEPAKQNLRRVLELSTSGLRQKPFAIGDE